MCSCVRLGGHLDRDRGLPSRHCDGRRREPTLEPGAKRDGELHHRHPRSGGADDAAQKAAYASLQQTADALADRSQAIASDVDDLKTRATQAQAQIELLYGDLQTSVAQLDQIYPDAGIAADVSGNENCKQLHS